MAEVEVKVEVKEEPQTDLVRCVCCLQYFRPDEEDGGFPGNAIDTISICFSIQVPSDSRPGNGFVCRTCTRRLIAAHQLKWNILMSLEKFNQRDKLPEVKPNVYTPSNTRRKSSDSLSEKYIKVNVDTTVRPRSGELLKYRCMECPKMYKTGRSLKNHMLTHKEGQIFKCTLCPKVFDSLYDLKSHTSFHMAKSLMFSNCSQLLNSKSILKTNFDAHTGDLFPKLDPKHDASNANSLLRCVDVDFKCTECSKEFRTTYDLKVHMKSHNIVRPVTSTEVTRNLLNIRTSVHSKTGDSQRPRLLIKNRILNTNTSLRPLDVNFQCTQCSKAFKSTYDLKVHMKIHNVKPVTSADFTKSPDPINILKIDTSTYGDTVVSQPGSSLNNDDLKTNSLFDTVDIDFQCTQCTEVFKSTFDLTIHMESHNNVKPATTADFTASEPNSIKIEPNASGNTGSLRPILLLTKDNLNAHTMLIGSLNKYACTLCSKVFPSSSALKEHKLSHGKSTVSFVCTKCLQVFKTDSELRTHVVSHSDDRIFRYAICPKTVKSTPDLQEQINRRNDAKIAVASKEPKPTVVAKQPRRIVGTLLPKSVLVEDNSAHSILLSSFSKFKCKLCLKVFQTACDLKVHRLSHAAELTFNCTVCYQMFGTEAELKAHTVIHSDVQSFKCALCPETLKSTQDLKEHMNGHGQASGTTSTNTSKSILKTTLDSQGDGDSLNLIQDIIDKKYKCNLCDEAFVYYTGLKKHMRTHGDMRIFKCTSCPKAYQCAGSLKRHILCHNNSFQCDVCSKFFPNKLKIRTHMKCHYRTADLECDVRSKPFSAGHGRRKHTAGHGDVQNLEGGPRDGPSEAKLAPRRCTIVSGSVKKYVCDICSKPFKYKNEIVLHLKQHDGTADFKCHVCSKPFYTHHKLKIHMVSHSDVRDFKCTLCDKAFKTKINLKMHMISHSDVRNHRCSLCPKAFKTGLSLKTHMLCHSDVRNFRCALCAKAFKTTAELRMHMVCHTDVRKYECTLCPKAFKSQNCLQKHLIRHRRMQYFVKCTVCFTRFRSALKLKQHMARHSDARNFRCTRCPKAYKYNYELKKHMNCHGEEQTFKCDHCPESFGCKSDIVEHLKNHI